MRAAFVLLVTAHLRLQLNIVGHLCVCVIYHIVCVRMCVVVSSKSLFLHVCSLLPEILIMSESLLLYLTTVTTLCPSRKSFHNKETFLIVASPRTVVVPPKCKVLFYTCRMAHTVICHCPLIHLYPSFMPTT